MLDRLLQLLRSEEMSERWTAVEQLRALSQPGKLERIAEVARDPGAGKLGRRDAVALIAAAEEPGAGELLFALAVEPRAPADARCYAVAALADRDPAALARAADALLRDPDPAVRAAVVADAWRLPRERAETIVRAALDDPATAVRSTACLPIAHADLPGLAGAVADAFAKIEERIRREKGSAGTWDVAWEEDALLRALAKRASDPDARQAVAPIVGRLIELAADPSSYDAQQGLLAGRNAAEILARTGVPDEHRDALARILRDNAVDLCVRESIRAALDQPRAR
jgi:hypothetical protein